MTTFFTLWWVIPIVLSVILYKFVLRFFFGMVIVPEDKIGLVTKKFVLFGADKSLPDSRIIATKGEEISEKNEQVSSLYKCIAQLDENERIIITMVLDEVTYPEIAAVSGISEGNLRVKIHRIKQKLTELYNRNERF